jgi:quercetin 2,3-dioxygenase
MKNLITGIPVLYVLSLFLLFNVTCAYCFQHKAYRESWNRFTNEQGHRLRAPQQQGCPKYNQQVHRGTSFTKALPTSNPTKHHLEKDSNQLNSFNEDCNKIELPPQYQQQIRSVQRIEKFARLPVWPVLNGVFIWFVGNIFGHERAAQLESIITGRVCPNFYQYTDTSPFIMLVHHCHTFHTLDPIRYIQRALFPEGFPAHPHRGFITITYILHGGFIHRDSEGIYQTYGSSLQTGNPDDVQQPNTYNKKHTQWLTTGRGMLHEEMFDIPNTFDINNLSSRQELYQIWLNVPAKYKMVEPCSLLLGGNNETPTIYGEDGISKTLVLAGSYNGQSSIAPIVTELVLFHVTLQPGTTWRYILPTPQYETAFIYVRQGSLHTIGPTTDIENKNGEFVIPVHHTAYFDRVGGNIIAVTAGNDEVADFMFLSGVPIKEPCYASGSMVMNYPSEIEDAYNDYQMGKFGIPWDYKLSNEQWKKFVQKKSIRQ